MKIPLRYQNTEYDCGTTSFVNALAYLYDREDIPVELLKAIYKLTLDVENQEGVVGEGGTSRQHAELLAKYFMKFASESDNFNIKCEVYRGDEVSLNHLKKALEKGVVIARCWCEGDHYVLITKINDTFAYIFDPYFVEEDHYTNDDDVTIVFHETFTHNRIVKVERLFDESKKDFSLLERNNRFMIALNR